MSPSSRHDPLEQLRSGPALELPIVYRFTSIPAPADHVVMRKLIPLEGIPAGSFIRGVELGFAKAPPAAIGGEEQLLAFLAGHPDDLGPVIVNVEWSQPAGGRGDVS